MPLIAPFDPWKNKICTCPAKFSLSAYTGCSHGCLYCYASSYIKNFHVCRPKKDFLEKLKKEIPKIPSSSFVTIANSSDPYLALEKKLKLTQKTLEVLKKYCLKVNLVTKSALIVRDLALIKEMNNIVISITLTSLNKSLAKKLEPLASLPRQRLNAMEKLSKNVTVVCRFDPLIYPLNTAEAKTVIKAAKDAGAKQIITSTYKIKPDNFRRMGEAFRQYKRLWNRLYLEEGERIANYIYLGRNLRKKIIEEVRDITLAEGLEFSSCREGFGGLNTCNCDGSSFFSPIGS
jgi:DNA repair photolyase